MGAAAIPPKDNDLAKLILASLSKDVTLSGLKAPSLPTSGKLPEILAQRHHQRRVIFWGAVSMSALLFMLLTSMLYIQAQVFLDTGKEAISEKIFMSVVFGIFGQIISVIVVISQAVWNDEPYKEMLNPDMTH